MCARAESLLRIRLSGCVICIFTTNTLTYRPQQQQGHLYKCTSTPEPSPFLSLLQRVLTEWGGAGRGALSSFHLGPCCRSSPGPKEDDKCYIVSATYWIELLGRDDEASTVFLNEAFPSLINFILLLWTVTRVRDLNASSTTRVVAVLWV